MRYHKPLKNLISFLCAVSILFSVISIPTFAVTDNTVTATTNSIVKQGNTAYCYVYIDSTEFLAALDVTVHFDPMKIKINNVYNSVSCTLYDSVANDSNIRFSYIFDGEGLASKTQLFYFTYHVLSNAEVGNAYFDITIGEAYDNSLNDVTVSGSRCNFTIDETVTTKSCSVYSRSSVSTGIEEEFSLSYRFSSYLIASGSAVIIYDAELFEVVDVTSGEFLTGKLTDINTDFAGAIYISFVGTEYNTNTNFLTVKFKTLENVTGKSEIALRVTELFDIDLNAMSCSGYTTTASVVYNESYTGDAPKMKVHAECDENGEKVTAVISLDKNSKLGAGDFVLAFDPAMLTLSSYEKGFEPTFFNINDKEAADGILKFSIISLEDIITDERVISVTFNTIKTCTEQTVTLDISGTMLSDSLTNKIALNFINGKVDIPEKHTYSSECDAICNVCGYVRSVGAHIYDNSCDTTCNICGATRTVKNHNYNDCFTGYNEELYGSWQITSTGTGIYQIKPNSNYTGNFSNHYIAVFDSNDNAIKYNEAKQGWPLVKDQQYTVKFRYNCSDEIVGSINWSKTKTNSTIFPDTNSGAWYNDAVTYAVGKGIMSGYGNGNFGPADSIQRQDFLVMLARYDGVDLSQYTGSSQFADVQTGSYYAAAVNWGAEKGIVSGYQGGTVFGVGDVITREQLVTFLYRYARYKGIDVSYSNTTRTEAQRKYKDYSQVSDWSLDCVLWALENNVINGKNANTSSPTIAPQGNAQRCEVAQIMYNIFNNNVF